MDNKKVSVIVPSFKADKSLIRAVDSALSQTYNNIEVIVVDDNDPDSQYRLQTEKMMECYTDNERVIYLKHERNKNGAAARNTGLAKANGEYVTFLDDDDLFYENRVSICVEALEQNPEYGGAYTNVVFYKEGIYRGVREAKLDGKFQKELLMNEGIFGTGSNLFLRREAVRETGGFDTRFIRYQDVEFMLRFLEYNKMLPIKQDLVRKNLCNRNIPNYPKFYENRRLVFEKFSSLIEELPGEDKKDFFAGHYKRLFDSALVSKNKSYISEAAQNLARYRPLSFKEKIAIQFPIIWIAYNRMYGIFDGIKQKPIE